MVPYLMGLQWFQRHLGRSGSSRSSVVSQSLCARRRALLNAIRYECGQVPREHSSGGQVRFSESPDKIVLIHFTGPDYRHRRSQ